jgi:hypothetical protein
MEWRRYWKLKVKGQIPLLFENWLQGKPMLEALGSENKKPA